MKHVLTIECGSHKYKEISFLKGFSIISIVLMHLIQSDLFTNLPSWFFKAASLGGTGVHIFFFSSGFGLWLSYSRKKTTYIEFIRKRFLKIYIPYIIVVLLTYMLPTVVMFNGNRTGALFSHIFLYKMFIPRYEESFGYFWFLSTLFQFYFVFIPLCIIKEKIGNNLFLLISIFLSVAWWVASWVSGINSERIWGSFFLQYLWEFSAGMIIADYLRKKSLSIPLLFLLGSSIIGITLEGIMATNETLKSFNDIPACVGFGSLALMLYKFKGIKSLGCKVSEFSYEWYLVHGLLILIVYHFLRPNIFLTQIGVGLVALFMSAAVGLIYHRIILFVRIKTKVLEEK